MNKIGDISLSININIQDLSTVILIGVLSLLININIQNIFPWILIYWLSSLFPHLTFPLKYILSHQDISLTWLIFLFSQIEISVMFRYIKIRKTHLKTQLLTQFMLSGVEYNSYYDFENQHTFPSLSCFDSNRRENGDPSTKYESSRDGDTLTKNTRAPETKIASTNKMATVTEIPYKNTRAPETEIPLQKYESSRDKDRLDK